MLIFEFELLDEKLCLEFELVLIFLKQLTIIMNLENKLENQKFFEKFEFLILFHEYFYEPLIK
jgi:hypothetical protein